MRYFSLEKNGSFRKELLSMKLREQLGPSGWSRYETMRNSVGVTSTVE